jgi:putative Mn2+ efflux pump MntP
MSPPTIAVLALSMSIDAFAVSVGRGAAIGTPPLRDALRTASIFGIIQETTLWGLGTMILLEHLAPR